MRKFFFLLLALISLMPYNKIAQAAFPDKPIIMIVPFSSGNDTDIAARALSMNMEREIGAKVIVKNIPGASGTLGTAELSKAAPDGHTIGILTVGPTSLQPQIRQLPYTSTSFKPVALVYNTPMILMVRKDSPLNTLADAKKFLLEKDGKAAFGSPGPGGLAHIASVAMFDAMGVKAKHIPDLSIAEVQKNLSGDVIQFYADVASCLNIYDVKALGIFAAERHPDFPDVPTMKEQGYDLEFSIWTGVGAPKDTPDEIVEQLEKALLTALASQQFKDIAQKYGIDIQAMGSKKFADFIEQRVAVGKVLIDKFDMKQQ